MAKRQQPWSLERQWKHWRQWNTTSESIAVEIEKLNALVQRSRPLVEIASMLGQLAFSFSIVGARRIINGNRKGWDDWYHWWNLRLIANVISLAELQNHIASQDATFEDARSIWKVTCAYGNIAEIYFPAIVFGESKAVSYLGDAFLRGMSIPTIAAFFEPCTPFAAFTFQFLAELSDTAVPNVVHSLGNEYGRFPGVIHHLKSGASELEPHLRGLIEYHARHVSGDPNATDFFTVTQSLWPAEIVAILQLRTQMGLANPQLAHPMMSTPFHPVPASFAKSASLPMLAKIREMCIKNYRDFTMPEIAG